VTSHLGNVALIAVEIHGKTTALATLSVSKKDHTLDFSPFDLTPGEKKFGFTRWQISRHF
jgi:translation elongation factor EF-Tu-like GTPase